MIIETANQLCEVVQYALQNKAYILPIINETELIHMAKENGLSGFIYTALNNKSTSPELKSALKKEHYIYFAQSTKQEEAIKDIKVTLSENKIRHIFLKGSVIRDLYPVPYMRSMGDIDIVVEKESMDLIHKIFEEKQYENIGNSEAHDRFKHPNGSDIEVHPRITRNTIGLETSLFDDTWICSFVEEGETYRLNPEFELTYLIYHAAKHFKSSGVGLRTLLDIGLYGRAYENSIDKETLLVMFEKANISKFSENMIKLQDSFFKLTTINNLYENESLSNEFIDFMTKYISVSGSHGTGDKFNNIIGRIVSSDVKYPKLDFLIKSLFPSLSVVSNHASFVKDRWYLYPIGWVVRLFNIVVLRRKTSFRKLQQLTIPKNYIDQSSSMFKELGL